MPAALRTALCAPSQPMTHRQRTVSIEPSSPRSDTVTVSPSWVRSVNARPRSISTPCSLNRSVRIRSVSCCERVRGSGYAVWFCGPVNWPAKSNSIALVANVMVRLDADSPAAIARSTTPMSSKISRVLGWTTSAREVVAGAGARSMIRGRTPCRANSFAIIRPVGPAPTTRTGSTGWFIANHLGVISFCVELFHYDCSTTCCGNQPLDQRPDIAAERPCRCGDQPGECQHGDQPEQQDTLAALPGPVELVEVNTGELP